MPSLPAKFMVGETQRTLHEYEGLQHLRVRAHGKTLIIESGPSDDSVRHARLAQDTVHLWLLDLAGRGDRWEWSGLRDTRENLLTALVEQFGWMLIDIAGNPERTSDREY